MLKRFKCPNPECKKYDQPFPVSVRVDAWFYEMPHLMCMHCDHDAELVPDKVTDGKS